ncbi:MAG: hypothetical protein NC120_12175 [Ruminococcus sp.]|nr:hypothetical protein [Ruminococcus sp.]
MKKFFMQALKVALMLAFAAVLFVVCLIVSLSMSDGLFSPLSKTEEFISYALLAGEAILFIFVCIKVSRIGTPPPDKDAGFLKKAKQPLLLIIPTILTAIVICAAPFITDEIENSVIKRRVLNAVNNASVIIDYQNNSDIYAGLEKFGVRRNSAVISYDKMSVIFISSSHITDRNFITLEKEDITSGLFRQFSYDLDFPGKRFSTYYGSYPHRTSAVKIEMEDGSVYSAAIDDEYYGIYAYPWEDIALARGNAEETVCYLPHGYMLRTAGLEGNTVFIDYDENSVSIAYADEKAAYFGKFELERCDSLENVYIQAEIPLKAPGKVLYIYREREPGEWDKSRSDGITLLYEDGSLYSGSSWGYYDFDKSGYYLDNAGFGTIESF